MGFLNVLTLIFVALKLAAVGSVASWSWWLVLSPTLVILLVVLVIAAIAVFGDSPTDRLMRQMRR